MDANIINGNLVRSVREFDGAMENKYENLMGEFRSDIKRIISRLADASSLWVNEDILSEFFDDEFNNHFDREVDKYISGIANQLSKEVSDYGRMFNAAFSKDDINNADIYNVNNKFKNVYASIVDKSKKIPNFNSLFDDFEYEFRRRFQMDEDMMYAFRNQIDSFKEKIENEIRSEINSTLSKIASELTQINKDGIQVLQEKNNERLKEISENMDLDATLLKINELKELAENVINTIAEYNNNIRHSTHSYHLRNGKNILGSLEEIISKVNNLSTDEEKKQYLAGRLFALPQVETTLNKYLNVSKAQYDKDVEKREQAEKDRIQKEAEERQRLIDETRRKIELEEARILEEEQREERRRQEITDFRNEHPEYTSFTNGRSREDNQRLQGGSSEPYADHFVKLAELGTVNEILADVHKINQIIAYDGDRHVFGSFIDMVNEGLKKGTVTSDELVHFRSGEVVDSIIDLDKTTRMYSGRHVYVSEKMDKLAYLTQLEDEPSLLTCFSRPAIIEGLKRNDRDYTYWVNSPLGVSVNGLEELCDIYKQNNLVTLSMDMLRKNRTHSSSIPSPEVVEKQRVESQNLHNENQRAMRDAIAGSTTEEVVEKLEEETTEVVVDEEVIEELEENGLEVIESQVEEDVVEQLEETGLVVVQPQVEQVVEETGLVVAQPQVEQVVEETGLVVQQQPQVVSTSVDFAGLTPHRVTAARKPIALIGETLEEVEELEESPIVAEEVVDEIPEVEEEEIQRDQGPYQSAKAQSMRKIIDSKKTMFDKRSTLAVLAAAGLGGASLIAGLPVTLPLIAAGLAVVSVGGHLQVNLKEFAGRKSTEFTLSTIAIMNDVELEYVDGKLKFTGKGGAELTQKQKEKLQRKLDKKFKNKYRGLSNPRLIQELQYKGFDKVTIDNLNAAFDEFGGITSKEVQSLLEEVNDIEVDLETETIEEDVPDVSEEEVLVAAEPEVEVIERQVVPANTSVITKIINGEDVQVLQGEVIDSSEEVIEEEVEQEQQYDFDVDPDLVNASQLLDANVGNAISTMNQSNIDAISQSCVDMFNGISDIFYNNRIENNEQLTALPMHKFNDDVRKINDNLMTSVKNHFDNINHQAMVATDRLMQVPNENKAELISNLQNAYLKHASISGMMKDLSSNFKELLDGICNQYGITQDSKAYSELVELMNQHQIKIESNMYNQMIEFTNVNAMAISTVFNTFGYKEDLNESRSRGM